MITPQADSRQPATWEANLLAGGQLVVLLVLSASRTGESSAWGSWQATHDICVEHPPSW